MCIEERDVYIKECKEEYMRLLSLISFPEFELRYKEQSSIENANNLFVINGAANYDCATGQHYLELDADIYKKGNIGKQTVFHEFTHIFDNEKFARKDCQRYIANFGYSEYHASQIAFLKALNMVSIDQENVFSMGDLIDTPSGNVSISDYVLEPILLATYAIRQSDFPRDFDELRKTLGLVFNYYGKRSICKMYANDYEDVADKDAIEKLLTPAKVRFLNNHLVGWLDNNGVADVDKIFYDTFITLFSYYNFI